MTRAAKETILLSAIVVATIVVVPSIGWAITPAKYKLGFSGTGVALLWTLLGVCGAAVSCLVRAVALGLGRLVPNASGWEPLVEVGTALLINGLAIAAGVSYICCSCRPYITGYE